MTAAKRGAGTSRVGRISAEIRQAYPFASLEREAAVTLLRTGDVLHHALDMALAPHGTSEEQYNVLRILRGAGEHGLPTLEIAQRMVARSPNITRLVDKLAAKGLVRRNAVTGDRRVVRITATKAGLETLGRSDEVVDRALARLTAPGPGELIQLVRILDTVRGHLAVPTAREGTAALRRKQTEVPSPARRRSGHHG